MRQATGWFLVALLWIVGGPRTNAAETAREIVEKAVEAHGGLDALKKYPVVKSKVRGTMTVRGQEVYLEGESAYAPPDLGKSLVKMEVHSQKVVIEQFWKDGAIKLAANGNSVPLSAKQTAELKDAMFAQTVLNLYPLLDDNAYELSVIDIPEKVNKRDVVAVLVKKKDHQDVQLFFDAKTYVCVKLQRTGLNDSEKEVKQEIIYTDLKKFDGILRAVNLDVINDGIKVFSLEISNIRHLEMIDKSEFDKFDKVD